MSYDFNFDVVLSDDLRINLDSVTSSEISRYFEIYLEKLISSGISIAALYQHYDNKYSAISFDLCSEDEHKEEYYVIFEVLESILTWLNSRLVADYMKEHGFILDKTDKFEKWVPVKDVVPFPEVL